MKEQPSVRGISFDQIPPKSRSITSIGDETAKAAIALFPSQQALFDVDDDGLNLDPLTDAFKQGKWTDADAAIIVGKYAEFLENKKDLAADVTTLARWVLQHPNDVEQVVECLSTIPPDETEIIKVLSRAGSQKVVFLATWRLTQAEVVLKKVIASTEASERILSRELRANPLNMVHPNIIETYVLKSKEGESFLVEKKLSDVLSDGWRSQGLHEAANLLFDVCNALKFLHDKNLIHGDVKPDNIGKRGNTYVLLDFGICREKEAYTPDATPTGSLRTRAPELLLKKEIKDPEKIDVWALGATVFNALSGRFPLIESEEKVPRISKPVDREKFEGMLALRVAEDWEKWVTFDNILEPMVSVLKGMLERDPEKRLSAREVSDNIKSALSAFIRSDGFKGETEARFSPLDELAQLSSYLESNPNVSKILPAARKKMIQERLETLDRTQGFDEVERSQIKKLIERIA